MAITGVVSSKGQVTLPMAFRKQLGIGPGSTISFEVDNQQIIIKPELPITAYRGMLAEFAKGIVDTEIPKERDRY